MLESLIADEPDNDSIKLVYGDWLEARGERWGELIALQHALYGGRDEPRFVWDNPAGVSYSVRVRPYDTRLFESSLGSLREEAPAGDDAASEAEALLRHALVQEIFGAEPRPRLIWRCGFIKRAFLPQYADFRPELEDCLISLLEHPVASALEELTIGEIEWRGGERNLHYQPELDVLAVLAPRSLRRLVLGAWSDHDISWTGIGDLRDIYKSLPQLRALELQAGLIELGDVAMPELRTLTLRSGGLAVEAIESVREADCPKLEALTMWFGSPEYGGSADLEVALPFLGLGIFPQLRSLGLCNAAFTDELCERLPSAPVLPMLEVLDLSLGTMSAPGARQLLAHRDAFAHLAHIDVHGNCLSAGDCAALERAFPSIDTRYQKSRGYRYVSVAE